jgi:hypothetical protein
MNEDELLRAYSEEAKFLSNQREKIFDREFEFRPSVDEALELIGLKETAEYVEPVTRKLEINNLRVLQKIAWAVEELNEHLADLDTAIKVRMLSQVAQIAAIRLRARGPLRSQDLQSGFHFELLKAIDSKHDLSTKEPENPFRNDLEALDYNAIPVDPILLGYLESGSFNQDAFKATLPSLTALHIEEEYHKQREAVSASIWGKFSRLDSQELDRIEQILDGEQVGQLGSGDLAFFQRILEIHGRPPNKAARELRWAEKVPVDHPSLSEFGLDKLQTQKAHDVIRAKIATAQEPDAPQTFQETLNRGRLSLRFLQSAEARDTAAIQGVLNSASDHYLIAKVSRLLREAQTPERQLPELSTLLPPFAEALLGALKNLCANDEMNRIRVESIMSRAERNE